MRFSGAAYAKAHEEEINKIVIAAEADFGARSVYSVQLPPGALSSDFGHTLEQIIPPLGAYIERRPALGSGEDIRELQAAGVPVESLRQDGLDYFDIHPPPTTRSTKSIQSSVSLHLSRRNVRRRFSEPCGGGEMSRATKRAGEANKRSAGTM
jgi:hypothetical protein